MKVNYEVLLSEERVAKKYNQLIGEMINHFKILIENDMPYRTFRAIKQRIENERRNLRVGNEKEEPEKLSGELVDLINEASRIFEIDLYPTAKAGILNKKGLTDAIIEHEYYRMAKNGEKYKKIKENLNKIYGVSVSAIEKIVYKKDKNEDRPIEPGDI